MSTNQTSHQPPGLGQRVSIRLALVGGVFSAVVCVLLLFDYSQRQAKDPLESPQYKALKAELAKQPRDEVLKRKIRALDLQLRRDYFRQRQFAASGAWLLLGGVAVSLVAAKWAMTLRRRLPMPQAQLAAADADSHLGRIARWSVAALAIVLAGSAMALSMGFHSELPDNPKQLALAPPPSPSVKSPQPSHPAEGRPARGEKPTALASNPLPAKTPVGAQGASRSKTTGVWPRFRGPEGTGVAKCKDVPATWDVASGKNVLWKTPVPLPGNNSPVVWNDRVFLTGASDEERMVYCFDADTGKLLWQQPVPGTPESTAKPPEVGEQTGLAASTAATDGQRVFAMFANGDLAAFDFTGKSVWARSLGMPKNSYGHAASLAMWRDRLLVQFDQGTVKEKLSKLLALDAATGKTVWETPREAPNSWPTPLVIQVGDQPQIVTCADPWVIAYEPTKGTEIWRAKCLRQDVGPSPTFAAGVVYTANEFPCASAIKADGRGDVTKSHVLWTAEDGLPDTCSPLANEQHLFLLASYGMLTCYDAKTGSKLWEEEFQDATFASSPSMVGKNIYVFSDEGKSWVVEPGQEGCKRVGEGNLGEKCVTSPAFQEGRLYIRGENHLFCLGNGK
jgi:outer membrane protein assembly factor BamB